MAKINDKTVQWVCKIMRQDARKNAQKDNPAFGYLPAAIRVQQRLTKGFMNIPKKDLHKGNKRTMFMLDAMSCADKICQSFDMFWQDYDCFESNYRMLADEE